MGVALALGWVVAAWLWWAGRIETQRRNAMEQHWVQALSGDESPGLIAEAVEAAQLRMAQMELTLRSRRDRVELMDSLLEQMPTGMLLIGADGRVMEANAAFRSLVPVREDAVGSLPVEGCHLAELQALVDRIRGDGAERAEVVTTSADRDVQLVALRLAQGCAVVLCSDITRFRQADRARTHFVSNVSHELRTPILSIMGFSETLLDDGAVQEPFVQRQLAAIHRNAIRLRDLFEDLLELSRIEARRSELPLERQYVAPVLERASVAAADMAYTRDQTFSLACDTDLEAWLNPEALGTIIGNLTSNACKYAGGGGRISVTARRVDDEVMVEVADDGPGIDPAHHVRIFERFYRVDEGRSRAEGGTGLGLAIVKHLALASRCRVTLESSPGLGSRFRVWLPDILTTPQG